MPHKSEKVNNGTFLFLPAQSELFADTYSKQVSILHQLGLYDRLNNVWLISHIVSVQIMYRHTYILMPSNIHTYHFTIQTHVSRTIHTSCWLSVSISSSSSSGNDHHFVWTDHVFIACFVFLFCLPVLDIFRCQ